MACEDLIQFDVNAVTSNITNEYAMLQYINQQNYERTKQAYSADFPGYFTGTYDDFRQQRNELTKLFISAGYANQQTSSYRRSLSPESAEAYSKCLAENSRKPIAAWIGKCADGKILVNLRNGLNEDVRYEVVGATPLNKHGLLPDGGTQALMFNYDETKDFMVAFNGIGVRSGTADTTLVELEKVRHFEVRTAQKELTATFTCGAGCQGNRDGCRISTDAEFVADQDYYLLYDTRRVVSTEVIGDSPGLMSYDLQWLVDSAAGATPRRVVAHPVNMHGNSSDTQGIVKVTCSIIAERKYVVEVVPLAAAPAAVRAAVPGAVPAPAPVNPGLAMVP